MDNTKDNCKEIKKASNIQTYTSILPYKTTILHGVINIISEFKKKKEDGVDYKNLCKEVHKYVNSQKKCVRQEIKNKGKTFVHKEWKTVLSSLLTTFNSHKVNRLCYMDDDKNIDHKKHILDLHESFRNFCIEKKGRLQNTSEVDFEKCSEYMSWIVEKKREIQARDPNYKYIEEYKEFFNIHTNCNHPWLLKDTPDITCRRRTITTAGEKKDKGKSLSDTSQDLPIANKDASTRNNNSNPSPEKPPSKVIDRASNLPPSSFPEQSPTKSTSHADGNTIAQPNISNVILSGTSFPEPDPIFPPPVDYDPKLKPFFEYLYNNLDGNKIHHDVDHSIKRKPVKISKDYPNYVQGDPILSTINKPYKHIPAGTLLSKNFFPLLLSKAQFAKTVPPLKQSLSPIVPSQPISPSIPNSKNFSITLPHAVNYVPINKSTKFAVPFINEHRPLPKIISGNKENETVLIEPAIPGASYFRSPSMIYTLVFLTIFTIISTFYLFSKYTPFGLLFSKKKKKKRLKRQLEIKKMPEESPSFHKITNYSVNDMPYENKTHDDNNIYSKIKIQKGVIKKNISLPKKKKNKRKALIDIHMELLNEYKNDEWELNKNDFLQICLEEFIREQNKIYSNSENTNLAMKNISIQNTKEDKIVLLDKWTERYRPIWEKFKSENAFKVLQYEWKKEEKEYLENIEQFENNILNENTEISYKEIKKEIWRKWITKQANIIEQFTQEKWFKSLVKQIEDVSNEYKMKEIKDDIFVLNIEKLDNINNNQESYKHDNNPFLIKVLTQIFMMVIEECIKEESPEKTELVLDNIISKINKEKCQNIKSHHVENTYEKSKDHLEYNEMLEKVTHKYKDRFNELMEGWKNKPDIDIDSTDEKNKAINR
ncbi:STP1 protein [Plasmodium ovale curtisi]|uniref:STP1 protein n=1 Tax=Plasmodium ovale curtisi TaxID=864141 RepID=A0A1A8W8N6_PLAOA|nr:STP1 protein [Plasmodium ovale curtisi]